jgi:hypothetical protein
MLRFLSQPDPIDGYEFHPIPADIHLGIIKNLAEEFLDDFGINTTETTLVGTDRKEVLGYLQTHFEMEFRRLSTLKESDSLLRNYEVKHTWNRIRKCIRNIPISNKRSHAIMTLI